MTVEQALDMAQQEAGRGNLLQAEILCRQILQQQPRHAEAQHLMGELLSKRGRLEEAVEAFRACLAVQADHVQAYQGLGMALARRNRWHEAFGAFSEVVRLRPEYAEGFCSLGNTQAALGELEMAVASYRRAVALKADFAWAYANLGNALTELGRHGEAIEAYRQSLRLQPEAGALHRGLGGALMAAGQATEAAGALREAVRLDPRDLQAWLGVTTACLQMRRLDEAMDACQTALRLAPASALAHDRLGHVLAARGQIELAVAAHRRATELAPQDPDIHSGLLGAMHYDPASDALAIGREARIWAARHADALRPAREEQRNDRTPDRRLRIGYVSPDFREHPVGLNLLPLFREHDHGAFTIFSYSRMAVADEVTRKFQARSDEWRETCGWSDERLARCVRADAIDILVDLALHSAGGSLRVFARRPAPVQVTFAGYPGTTGLAAIDYRLTDPWLDPPGGDESVYAERTIRLPETFWCYDPLAEDLEVGALPALAAGRITFGALNSFHKVNDSTLRLWGQVLRAVPGSRVLLLSGQGSHRERARSVVAEAGVEPGRVEFVEFRPRREYLKYYREIDLGLDTLPYNGHTTSLDSYWMGVPVVTLVGRCAAGRAGLSQLANLGLKELAAQTPEAYVAMASEWARDVSRLATVRMELRERMRNSPLMNGRQFARNMESAYRRMWKVWCSGMRAEEGN